MRKLALSALGFAYLLQADFDPSRWQFRRSIQLKDTASIGSIKLDTMIYRGSASRLADLRVLNLGTTDLGDLVKASYTPIARGIREMEKPVICAVNGVAAGAGANLALACDIVIAAKSASFIQAFCKIGLIPDSGGTYFLPRLAGTARAMGLSLLGDKLPAEQAAQWGLIWQCVEDAELVPAVDKLLMGLAAAPTAGLAAAKRAIYASAANSLEVQLDLERDLQRALGYGPDYREGVTAFAEKRPPKFTGR